MLPWNFSLSAGSFRRRSSSRHRRMSLQLEAFIEGVAVIQLLLANNKLSHAVMVVIFLLLMDTSFILFSHRRYLL